MLLEGREEMGVGLEGEGRDDVEEVCHGSFCSLGVRFRLSRSRDSSSDSALCILPKCQQTPPHHTPNIFRQSSPPFHQTFAPAALLPSPSPMAPKKLYSRPAIRKLIKAHTNRPLSKNADILVCLPFPLPSPFRITCLHPLLSTSIISATRTKTPGKVRLTDCTFRYS